MPGSAIAARSNSPAPTSTVFNTYTLPTRAVPSSTATEDGAIRLCVRLMERAVEPLNRRFALLTQGLAISPEAHQTDLDLAALDARLQADK